MDRSNVTPRWTRLVDRTRFETFCLLCQPKHRLGFKNNALNPGNNSYAAGVITQG